MIRRPPRSTQSRSSAASDVYKRQVLVMVSSVRARRSSLAGVSFPLTHSRVSCLCDRRAAPNDLRDGALGLIRPASRSRTRSSAGEHLVDIEGVTGSIPVASTTQSPRFFEVDVEAIASDPKFSDLRQVIALQDRKNLPGLRRPVSRWAEGRNYRPEFNGL